MQGRWLLAEVVATHAAAGEKQHSMRCNFSGCCWMPGDGEATEGGSGGSCGGSDKWKAWTTVREKAGDDGYGAADEVRC